VRRLGERWVEANERSQLHNDFVVSIKASKPPIARETRVAEGREYCYELYRMLDPPGKYFVAETESAIAGGETHFDVYLLDDGLTYFEAGDRDQAVSSRFAFKNRTHPDYEGALRSLAKKAGYSKP
jgi:hypothetical protein